MTRPPSKPQHSSSDRVRSGKGPAILTYGYRPFFLMAGIWAVLAMAAWAAMLAGFIILPTRFDPVSWHAHEMLFGYLGTALAGFLLTAVPNWTGRLPIVGWPLAALVALWATGRIAVAASGSLSLTLVAILDLLFPVVFGAVIGREILAGKNWRNLPILALLVLLIVANVLFHVDAAQGDYAASGIGFRTGLAAAVMLVTLIGGRIVPSFTRNWLEKRKIENFPASFGVVDKFALVSTLIALIGWTVLPDHAATAILCTLAGIANLIRLSRWSGMRTGPEPLLWILHVGYLFVPFGFLSVAASMLDPRLSPSIGAQHIWMAGAVGVMPLAMMTRASLGHAGRPLKATRGVTVVYFLIIASVLLRFIAAFDAAPAWVMYVSAFSWIAGFAGFSILYWPILTKPRSYQ